MQVFVAIDSLGVGGAERSLAHLLPALREMGFGFTLICLDRRPAGVEDQLREQGFEIVLLSAGSFPGRVLELRRLLCQRRPTLLHTTLFRSNMVSRLAAAGTGVPVVESIVNTRYDPSRLRDPNTTPWKLRLVQVLDAVTARALVTHFHAISCTVKRSAVRQMRLDPGRITVIERGRRAELLGTASPQRRARARAELGLSQTAPVILNAARQEYQKGQIYLIRAVPELLGRFPDLKVLIAGRQGAMTRRLQQAVAGAGLESTVRFLGHRDDLPEVLAAADLFVFPSLHEGLGGVLLEAMALSLPIVASDLEVFEEVLEGDGNALLVPPEQPDELARAIARLLRDAQLRERFSARSRQIFQERFALARSLELTGALYRRLGSFSST